MGTRTIKLGESFRVDVTSSSGSHAEVRMVIEELLVQHSCPCIFTNYTSQSHAWHVNLNRGQYFLRGILSYRCPDRLMI